MFKKIFGFKISVVLISLIYSYVFYYGYIEFLNGWFDYAGFKILDGRMDNYPLLITSIIMCIIPLVAHNGFDKISAFLCIFIYYLLYIPIIITFYFMLEGDYSYLLYLQGMFMFGMIILFLADRFSLKHSLVLPADFNIFKFVLVLCILCTVYVAFIYRNNLKFVGFNDVYEHRSASELLGSDVFTGYITVWLHNVIIPICLSYSFFSKKKIYFIIGAVSSIIIYMATAAKSVLLFPVMFIILYFFLRKRNLKKSIISIGAALVIIMVTTLYFGFNNFSSLLWMRTIGNGGFLTKYYHEFFTNHPITYYSHINIVNAITGSYPYDKTLGEVLGEKYWNDANTNANFWATDGFAALGDFGIIFSSILLFFLFIIFNNITVRYKKLFVVLILIPYTLALLNASLFSSLITGGGFFILLFLSLNSTSKNKYIINENSNAL